MFFSPETGLPGEYAAPPCCSLGHLHCLLRNMHNTRPAEFITVLPRTQACVNKMAETYGWSKISSGFPYDVDTISLASRASAQLECPNFKSTYFVPGPSKYTTRLELVRPGLLVISLPCMCIRLLLPRCSGLLCSCHRELLQIDTS